MNEYTYTLKNGETIIFKSDMPRGEGRSLPAFTSQYKLFSYFQDKGYKLEIVIIIKNH